MNEKKTSSDALILGGHRGMGCTDHDKYQTIRDIKNLPVENTNDSIAAAYDGGAAYVELDAVESADEVSFVLHNVVPKDHFFGQDMPPQKLNAMNFADFKNVRTGRFSKGTVATMADVLETIAAKDPKILDWAVNIEIKGVQGSQQNYETNNFLDNLAETVKKSSLDPKRVLFSSFSLQNIIRMSHIFPQSIYGMLFAEKGEPKAIYADHQNAFAYRYLQFDAPTIDDVLAEWKNNAKDGVALKYMHPEILTVDEAILDRMAQDNLGVNCWALFEAFNAARGALYKDVVGKARERNVPFTVITDYIPEMQKAFAP